MRNYLNKLAVFFLLLLTTCTDKNGNLIPLVNLNIRPVANADARSSYTNSKADIMISYDAIPLDPPVTGDLRDAIAYIDANGDQITDVFFGTGRFDYEEEFDCILAINDGNQMFTTTTTPFGGNMPKATHARKSIVSDFNNDGLQDVMVLDHGLDRDPFPGNNPKLIIQNSVGLFSWTRLTDQTDFHHCGAAADIDNDGDVDVFVGGGDPFFYINDGNANFTLAKDRSDPSGYPTIYTSELIDVDQDGFVDLLVGAFEFDDEPTAIYWGSEYGAYGPGKRTILPVFDGYGTPLDFDAEDLDKEGDRDLVVNRAGGGNNNFYIGSRVQLLMNNGDRTFQDATNKIDMPTLTDPDLWFPWIRLIDYDQDGDLDILPDDLSIPYKLVNDGNGNFTRM